MVFHTSWVKVVIAFNFSAIRHFWNEKELGRVNIRKEFWDCYKGREKIANSLLMRPQ